MNESSGFTKKQITRILLKNKIGLEGLTISHNEIEICLGYEEHNGRGNCDSDLVDAKHHEIGKVLPTFGSGYYTGYGALVCQHNYEGMGDWNDKSSKHHY